MCSLVTSLACFIQFSGNLVNLRAKLNLLTVTAPVQYQPAGGDPEPDQVITRVDEIEETTEEDRSTMFTYQLCAQAGMARPPVYGDLLRTRPTSKQKVIKCHEYNPAG